MPQGILMSTLIASLAASRRRSCPRCTGRTSPASPTSPNTTCFAGSGLFLKLLTMASSTARSASGSSMRTPPTALMKISIRVLRIGSVIVIFALMSHREDGDSLRIFDLEQRDVSSIAERDQ